VLCVVLAGGFTTNFLWCLYLIISNGTGPEFVAAGGRRRMRTEDALLYLRTTSFPRSWYGMVFPILLLHDGESQMGAYAFSSWTLHMASIIIFSTFGIRAARMGGSRASTKRVVWSGCWYWSSRRS